MPTDWIPDDWKLDAIDSLETVTVMNRRTFTDSDHEQKQEWADVGTLQMDIQPLGQRSLRVLPPALREVVTEVAYGPVSALLKVGGRIVTADGSIYEIQSVANWDSHVECSLSTARSP